MPQVTRPDGTLIHYEVMGAGEPVLALAPGGVSSSIGRWAAYRIDPVALLADAFTVIVMDQRFAGQSQAPLCAFSYEEAAADQLAVLDAVGARRAQVIGADFGAVQALRLAYDAPARVTSAVLLEPVGFDESNGIDDYYAPFNETIRVARAEGIDGVLDAAREDGSFARNPAAGPWAQRLHHDAGFRDAVRALGRETYITLVVDFRDGMCPWGRQFFAVNDLAVERVGVPLLVVPGVDPLHPAGVAQVLVQAAPRAQALGIGDVDKLGAGIAAFLRQQQTLQKATPAA